MSFTGSALVFLGMVAAISVTGVMMPGPVTAAAIAKGYRSRWAGLHIALGHGVVEFPTIAFIALGFSTVLAHPYVSIAIGILGGAMLVFMGGSMLLGKGGVIGKLKKEGAAGSVQGTGTNSGGREPGAGTTTEGAGNREQGAGTDEGAGGKEDAAVPADPFPYNPFVAGVLTTASNPYYFLWWATLGAALTLNALELGLFVLVAFAVVHWSIDLGWDFFLAYTVHRSRGFWNRRTYLAVFALCGAVMLAFGLWFAGSALLTALSL